ncbi:MAG: hypothetical protein FRX48_09281 [Lasallia pustulata]|uniref:Uncharacterized protein n=1 Tax=Lasallia pustulata TaxID=136370 RepID=A0A5M8PD53_9LECA|nr:MAG: hypothetical protein FRX48_09281 [Lasallia pustulata]
MAEQMQGNNRIFCYFPFVEHEEAPHADAKYKKADDGRGIPGMRDTAKVKAQEEHQRAANDQQATGPVNSLQAFPYGRFGGVQFQSEVQKAEDYSCDWYCDPVSNIARSFQQQEHVRLM